MKPEYMSDAEFYERFTRHLRLVLFCASNPSTKSVPIFKIEEENRARLPTSETRQFRTHYFVTLFPRNKLRALQYRRTRPARPAKKRPAHGSVTGHHRILTMPRARQGFHHLWQNSRALSDGRHDIWRRIIVAALTESATEMDPCSSHRAFDKPVASQYHGDDVINPKMVRNLYCALARLNTVVRPLQLSAWAFKSTLTADGLLNDDDAAMDGKGERGALWRKAKPGCALRHRFNESGKEMYWSADGACGSSQRI